MAPNILSKEQMIKMGIYKEGISAKGETETSQKPVSINDFDKHVKAAQVYREQTGMFDPSEPEGSKH